MFVFRKKYFFFFILLFVIEICIALFVQDKFIRPYIGDFLVVILIYCFLRSFFDIKARQAAISVLLFSFVVEFLQYFELVDKLGLQHSKAARIIIGTTFHWVDLLVYFLSFLTILLVEQKRTK